MTNKPNDSQEQNGVIIDRFYTKEEGPKRQQVSIYLDPDVVGALNKFGKENGKGSKSELVNNFLIQLLNIGQGQQVVMHKTSEQINAPMENRQC